MLDRGEYGVAMVFLAREEFRREVIRIDDTRQPRIVPPQPMMMRAAAAADSAATTPVEPGLIEIHGQVTLTVTIK